MTPFEFTSVARIVFGRGQFAKVGAISREFGRAALIIHNTGETGSGGLGDRLAALLKEAGVSPVIYRQRGEPQTRHVDEALAIARETGCDLLVGLGGGSAIDAAKAVAGLLGNGGSVLDYMEIIGKGQKITRPAVPWIAIPTTAGTGAEVTRNAVIGAPEKKFKASLRSEHLLARVALVDAELAVGTPSGVTARCGMDALCQLIESYTSTGANVMTDALALRGISLAARSLRIAFAHGTNLDARDDLAMAALLSGIALTNAGLGAVHGFAAPLGANFPVPHGTVCGVLLPLVIKANISAMRAVKHPRLNRYADIGRLLTGDSSLSADPAVDACATATRSLAGDLQMPSLAAFGLTAESIPEMVALARQASSMRFNPIELTEQALADILRQAIFEPR